MIKRLVRTLGFLLLAVGFVVIVIDGSASIAASALRYTTLGDLAARFLPTSYPEWEARLSHINRLLWDPAMVTALKAPASLAMIFLALLLLFLARRRPEGIGYPARL